MKTQKDTFLEIYEGLNFDKIIDHPNILIAANFWEEERFRAAKTCYKLMRGIDDMIDNYKAENKVIAASEKEIFVSKVNQWISSIKDKTYSGPFQQELVETFEKFRIPLWTMEDFAKAMIYDIHNSGFASMKSFLEYSKGASVAPAGVFVHLCGIRKTVSAYDLPVFDVRLAATPCAVFSYIVHIIRDFQKDQENNLNYFADDLILRNGLSKPDLLEMAAGGKIRSGFRSLVNEYYLLAEQYRVKTLEMINEISPMLEPRQQLSLQIIYNLYLMVFERINIEEGKFSTEELNPTAGEIRSRVYRVICEFREVKKQHFVNCQN